MNTKQVKGLRIMAKVWSILSIGFVLLFVIGGGLSGAEPMPTASEWVGLAFFPIGVTIGLALAWWREGIGGTVAVLSLIAFYIWDFARSGDLPGGPYFLLVAAPGFLFLACWLWSRDRSGVQHA
jgi:hypothetical protein